MSMRSEILGKIRDSIGGTDERRKVTSERMGKSSRGITPYDLKNNKDTFELFKEKLAASLASFDECKPSEVEGKIIDFLRRQNAPLSFRMGESPELDKYNLGKNKLLEVKHGKSDGNDLASVSTAFCGVAETGTLALTSGSENPTTLNFLPENHIVIMRKSDVIGHQEDVWTKLREAYGEQVMPRTVNFITGPSRSADIEQTMILGAHGPIRLHVIMVP